MELLKHTFSPKRDEKTGFISWFLRLEILNEPLLNDLHGIDFEDPLVDSFVEFPSLHTPSFLEKLRNEFGLDYDRIHRSLQRLELFLQTFHCYDLPNMTTVGDLQHEVLDRFLSVVALRFLWPLINIVSQQQVHEFNLTVDSFEGRCNELVEFMHTLQILQLKMKDEIWPSWGQCYCCNRASRQINNESLLLPLELNVARGPQFGYPHVISKPVILELARS